MGRHSAPDDEPERYSLPVYRGGINEGIPQLPRGPSGRVPQWVINEALGIHSEPSPWRADFAPVVSGAAPGHRGTGGAPSGRRKPSRGFLRSVAVLFFVALIGGMAWWTIDSRTPTQIATPPPVALPDQTGWRTTYSDGPTPGFGSESEPLGTPAPLATRSDSYRIFTSEGDSVHGDMPADAPTYDPCRPVHYVIRESATPRGGNELIHAAVEEASRATGLQFVYDGTTDEFPVRRRQSYQPDRYGDRWAPILIAWSDPSEVSGLAGDVIGLGGSTSVTQMGRTPVYVTGQIELDTPEIALILRSSDGAALVQAII